MFGSSVLLSTFASTALAGTILWDGRFNDLTSSTDLNNWSFSNEVGPYQYYIHGTGSVTDYVNLDASFKNPADSGSDKGVKVTIDDTSVWNGDSMLRTELIPQTDAAINAGKVFYHFSMKRTDTNAPSDNFEHQVNFFESHFTEMKYGWISGQSGDSNASLQWFVGGASKWVVDFDADVWHNVAYEIDFSAGTVAFHHSTGADDLALTAGPFTASTSSNGADWHLGVLRLARSGFDGSAPEDWYFSGVYVESDSLTTTVSNGGSSSGGDTTAPSSSSAAAAPVVSSTAAAPVSTKAAAVSSSSVAAAVSTPVVVPSSSAAAVSTPVAVSSSSAIPVITPISSSPAAPATTSAPAEVPTPSSVASGPTTTYINGEWWVCN